MDQPQRLPGEPESADEAKQSDSPKLARAKSEGQGGTEQTSNDSNDCHAGGDTGAHCPDHSLHNPPPGRTAASDGRSTRGGIVGQQLEEGDEAAEEQEPAGGLAALELVARLGSRPDKGQPEDAEEQRHEVAAPAKAEAQERVPAVGHAAV